ncbi:hypothetical protein [Nocardiopsis trehalosi]|uniref:hypothetical protein n=1 Tax=Nocardiopsis trehalosi TaxID=109329 RepID=UPI00082CD307|nr:hypothetical protein [Nocardiopsis trehalosi]
MIDSELVTTVLVITLVGIGLVVAGGIAYIADDAVRRRRTARGAGAARHAAAPDRDPAPAPSPAEAPPTHGREPAGHPA